MYCHATDSFKIPWKHHIAVKIDRLIASLLFDELNASMWKQYVVCTCKQGLYVCHILTIWCGAIPNHDYFIR